MWLPCNTLRMSFSHSVGEVVISPPTIRWENLGHEILWRRLGFWISITVTKLVVLFYYLVVQLHRWVHWAMYCVRHVGKVELNSVIFFTCALYYDGRVCMNILWSIHYYTNTSSCSEVDWYEWWEHMWYLIRINNANIIITIHINIIFVHHNYHQLKPLLLVSKWRVVKRGWEEVNGMFYQLVTEPRRWLVLAISSARFELKFLRLLTWVCYITQIPWRRNYFYYAIAENLFATVNIIIVLLCVPHS